MGKGASEMRGYDATGASDRDADLAGDARDMSNWVYGAESGPFDADDTRGTHDTGSAEQQTPSWAGASEPYAEDDNLATDVDSGRDQGTGGWTGDWSGTSTDANAGIYRDGTAEAVESGYDYAYANIGADAGANRAGDGIASTDDEDPARIRTEIEHTRAEMSSTINAIQEKLNPQALIEQAKDTLQETAANIVDKAKDSVHDATIGRVEQMVTNVADTAKDTGGSLMHIVKDNPVQAALVGLGLGWLLARNNKGSSGEERGNVNYGSGSYYGYPSRATNAQDYPYEDYGPRYVQRGAYQQQGGYQEESSGLMEGIVDKVKENPIPVALAGVGLWMLMGGNGNDSKGNRAAYGSYGSSYGLRQSGGSENPVQNVQNKVGEVAEQARDTAGEVVGQVKDVAANAASTVGDVASQVRDTAGEVVGNVAEKAGEVVGGTGDVGSKLLKTLTENPLPATLAAAGIGWLLIENNSQSRRRLHRVGRLVGDVAGQAGDAIGSIPGAAGDTVGNVADSVKQGAEQGQTQLQRMLMENPLAVGALAVAVGAAVGAAIPETPQEHQLMGSMRDKVVERVQSVAQDTMQKVQQKTEEVAQQVQETTREAAQQVEETAAWAQNSDQDQSQYMNLST